jgi:amino acid adenylation domain
MVPSYDSAENNGFPITATQEAYLVGRSSSVSFGDIGCHGYWEWLSDYEPGNETQVREAWGEIVDRHPSLRTVILDASTQIVLDESANWDFVVNDWRHLSEDAAQQELEKLRKNFSHHVFDPSVFPLWDVQVSILPNTKMILHFSLDLLVADAWSYYQVLVPELVTLLKGEKLEPAPTASFQTWVHEQDEEMKGGRDWQSAEKYWLERLETLPSAPQLPQGNGMGSEFSRLEDNLSAALWEQIREAAKKRGVTGTALMAALLSEALQRWGAGNHFVITIPTFAASRASNEYSNVVGDFTSTILLEVDGSGKNFTERSQAIQRQLWSDLPHSTFSGIHVARAMARTTGSTEANFPIVLTSLLGQPPRRYHTELGEEIYTSTQTPQVSLDVQVAELDGALTWSWDYRRSAYPKGLIDDIFKEFGNAVRLLANNKAWEREGLLAELPADQVRVRALANETEGPIPEAALVSNGLQCARETPDAPALLGQISLSYGQLLNKIKNAVKVINSNAVGFGPVAIVMPKGAAQIIYAHAANFSGRSFAPLDHNQPHSRLQQTLKSGKPSLIITSYESAESIGKLSETPVVGIEQTLPEETREETLEARISTESYIIHTSGTSGPPKGISVSQKGVANAFSHMIEIAGIDSTDVAYAVSPFHFDLGMFEALGMLSIGASVVMAPDEVHPLKWLSDVQKYEVTVWNSTPAILGLLLQAAESQGQVLSSLRTVILAGDRIPVSLPEQLWNLAPNANLIASGGPAETCVWSIYYPVPRNFSPVQEAIPYGRPMRNQKYYILDEQGRETPDWVTGEMVVESAVGLADGYVNQPELTNAKFYVDPESGQRRYRTGDLGRWRPDGLIEILGRKDFQVKINGIRIELGEVVEALKSYPGVRDAIPVQARSMTNSPLVGFVLKEEADFSEESVRAHVEARLPRVAVPSRIVAVNAFPLTRNGKVDISTLEKKAAEILQESNNLDAEDSELSATENVLSACWYACLGSHVGTNQNFFNAGASSLDLMKVAVRFSSAVGMDFSSKILFTNPTIRTACAALKAQNGSDLERRCETIMKA